MKAILIDTTRCMGCRACQVACKQWNGLPGERTRFGGNYGNPQELSPQTWSVVSFKERKIEGRMNWYYGRLQCMHCIDAVCGDVCPVAAIETTADGQVIVDRKKCVGCKNCVANCPFAIPRYDSRTDTVKKCTFCFDRLEEGLEPACAKTCPTGAIRFDYRDEVLEIARERVDDLQAKGYHQARIYGEEELGGRRKMYVIRDHPGLYGLPADPKPSAKAYFWSVAARPMRVLATFGAFIGLLGYKESEGEEKEI